MSIVSQGERYAPRTLPVFEFRCPASKIGWVTRAISSFPQSSGGNPGAERCAESDAAAIIRMDPGLRPAGMTKREGRGGGPSGALVSFSSLSGEASGVMTAASKIDVLSRIRGAQPAYVRGRRPRWLTHHWRERPTPLRSGIGARPARQAAAHSRAQRARKGSARGKPRLSVFPSRVQRRQPRKRRLEKISSWACGAGRMDAADRIRMDPGLRIAGMTDRETAGMPNVR